MTERQVVHRVEDGMDRQTVEATTYQMRNPFKQLKDGFFQALDVFNYQHHHHIAKDLARKGDRVLDVCCGRGILLPLLRYHAPEIALYVGVDIEPDNAIWLDRRVTDNRPLSELKIPKTDGETYTRETYYPFRTEFVEANVAWMSDPVSEVWDWPEDDEVEGFDLIVYTQSIEHMHPHAGLSSLEECFKLAAPGARMILSGPNTPEHQDGYSSSKRAHVYEWKRSELLDALGVTGWRVEREWGLLIGKRRLGELFSERGLEREWKVLSESVPSEWLTPVLAPLFPEEADEIAILATRTIDGVPTERHPVQLSLE